MVVVLYQRGAFVGVHQLIYLNKSAIGGFANDYYWSSSEHDDDGDLGQYDGIYAWWVRFNTGEKSWGDKNAPDYVRAARYF